MWPSSYAFGDDLGLKRGGDHARVMKRRGRIPEVYWPKVLKAAHQRGIPLSKEVLAAAHNLHFARAR